MKTTLQDEINNFEESYINNDSQLVEPVPYNVDNVTKKVMKSIKKKPVKKKKWIPVLVAAVLLTAAIGTTVLASTGVFTPFSGKLHGDTSNLKVYSNDSFRFTSSDDNLQAEFAGFVGDEDFTLAAIEITKKDGQPFISEDGVLSGQSKLAQSGYSYRAESDDHKEQDAKTELPDYYLSKDKKTLTLYLTVNTASDDTEKTILRFDSQKLYAYSIKDKISESNLFTTDYLDDSVENDAILHLYEDNKYMKYSISTTAYDLPYSVYLELNEKPEVFLKQKIGEEKARNLIKYKEQLEMTVSPFKIKFTQNKTFTNSEIRNIHKRLNDYGYQDNQAVCDILSPVNNSEDCIQVLNSGVMTKDGKRYYLIQKEIPTKLELDRNDKSKWNVTTKLDLFFTEYPLDYYTAVNHYNKLSFVVIDPAQIGAIIINGNTVYAAPGCEDMELSQPKALGQEWNLSELKELLKETPLDLTSCSIGQSYLGDDYQCEATRVDCTLSGSKDDILSFVRRISREQERGLFITEITLTKAQDSTYEMAASIINPYITDSADFPKSNEEYLNLFAKYDWNDICSQYFSKGILPEGNVPFHIGNDKTPDTPSDITEDPDQTITQNDLPILTSPAEGPERNPVIRSDMNKLTLKIWKDEELQQVLHGENNQPVNKNDIQITKDYEYDTTDAIRCTMVEFTADFTKNGLFNYVNEMVTQEENNLFITDIEMVADDEKSGWFHTTITLMNPYIHPSETAQEFGYLSRSELLSAVFDASKDQVISSLALRLNKHYLDGTEPHNAVAVINCFWPNSSYGNFVEMKDKTEQEGTFHFGEELSASVYHDDASDMTGLYLNYNLVTDAFNQ